MVAHTRASMVEAANSLIAETGQVVSREGLAAHLGIARARVDATFPEEAALFDAVVEEWYAPYLAIMDEVLASDLPPARKLYEFIARRFELERERYHEDPATFRLLVQIGTDRFEQVRGYIELADHYMAQIIAEAQAEGFFPGLSIDRALTLINQMVAPYVSPVVLMMLEERLASDKLAAIIDTIFAGLASGERGAAPVRELSAVR